MSSLVSDDLKVFISYSHDSNQHKDRVLVLSDRLRADGIDCTIDQYETSPPEGWARWCDQNIEEAHFVLVACTQTYVQRFKGIDTTEKGKGVKWEGAIITQELYDVQAKNKKFIPIIFGSEDEAHIPIILRGVTSYKVFTEEGYESLYRHLTSQPSISKPELGKLKSMPPLARQPQEEEITQREGEEIERLKKQRKEQERIAREKEDLKVGERKENVPYKKFLIVIGILCILLVGYFIFPRQATGSISVSSSPSGASLYLDGSYQGTTPMTIKSVRADSHTIKLKLTGYLDWSQTIIVNTDEIILASANLTQPEPTLTPTKTPTPTPTSTIITSPIVPRVTISPKAISPTNIEQVTQLKVLKSNWVHQLAWSPDGKVLAIATYGLSLNDITTFQQTCKIDIGWVKSVAFSPDGQTLATASNDGIKIWKVDGCGELGTFALTEDANSVDFSPDGMKLAAGVGKTVKLFDVATKSELKTFIGHQSQVNTVVFSSDGQTLASGSDNIKLWDVPSGRELHTLEQNNVLSVAFSPEGKILASGSVYDNIKLWDVKSGYILRTLTGHTGQIDSVVFSPDGELIASASWDLTVRLWDVASGKEVRSLTGHTDWLRSVVFSPDGSILASGGEDEAVRLWGIPP